MPASVAQIRANQQNAANSTGPKTDEGKERSRANAYKHGLTGGGIVVSDADANKIRQLASDFTVEFRPSTSSSLQLVQRMAVLAVRMDRSVKQESAAITDRVRLAEANFEAPEGLDAATVAKLRREAGEIALFDPSKEASLARQYEAAAERGFFRAMKELRQMKKDNQGFDDDRSAEASRQELGSFLEKQRIEAEMAMLARKLSIPTPVRPRNPVNSYPQGTPGTRVDVPITIGRPR